MIDIKGLRIDADGLFDVCKILRIFVKGFKGLELI